MGSPVGSMKTLSTDSDAEKRLKGRFGRFLAVRTDDPASAIRLGIDEVLQRIRRRGWRAFIVGGTIRDVMLAPPSAFPRDIDIVLSGASQRELDVEFADLLKRTTRFGGLHLVKPINLVGDRADVEAEIVFDVWRLEDTWGIRHAGLAPTIESFVRTPFLNIDSAAMELTPRNARRHLVEHGFFTSISSSLLEINYEPNPFPLVCIVRSLIMAAKLRFALGPSLARFVSGFHRWGSVDDLVEAQVSHYGDVRCSAKELRLWLDEITQAVASGATRIEVYASEERQMELWSQWPPRALRRAPRVFVRAYSPRKRQSVRIQGQLKLLAESD